MRLPVDALTMMGLAICHLRRCGCGQRRLHLKIIYLSGSGFAWLYQHYYHQPLRLPKLLRFIDQGDEQARAHVERYLDLYRGFLLGNILTIVDSDLVVDIGGGLSNFPATRTQLADRLPGHYLSRVFRDTPGGARR